MPTVIREDGFEIRIYTHDHQPPHVHVFLAGVEAKLTIDEVPVLIGGTHMRTGDLRRAAELVAKHLDVLMATWRAIHG